VALWRERWKNQSELLDSAEEQQVTDKKLRVLIEEILSDRQRPGTTKSFSVEQVVKIVAIACESPERSDRPVSHWTPSELASEAIKRGIVEKISPRTVAGLFQSQEKRRKDELTANRKEKWQIMPN